MFRHHRAVSNLGQLQEFKHSVDVGFDFYELGRGVGRLVGGLRSFLVVKATDHADSVHDLAIGSLVHQVLAALRSLHLQSVLFVADLLRPHLVLFHCVFQVLNFSELLNLNLKELFALDFGLLLVFLPLLDVGQVFLFELNKVVHQLLRVLERQFIRLVRAVFIKQLFQLLRVLNFVLSQVACISVVLRVSCVCCAPLGWNRATLGVSATTTSRSSRSIDRLCFPLVLVFLALCLLQLFLLF